MSIEKQSRIYQELAEKYREKNGNQSWLCYENALFHCQREPYGAETEEFCRACRAQMEILEHQPGFAVAKTAIVILSHNHAELTRACIESIRQQNHPQSYELVVVDNASSDGALQWLRQQKDVHLLENQENQGFPCGCNQGIALAEKSSDILLLNNDTLVPENAVFWLRMGLYQEEGIGATGSVSNNVVNYQQVAQQFDTTQQWLDFARENNAPMDHFLEKKSWLVGFAMLIKRAALNALLEQEPELSKKDPHEFLDPRFSPGNFEDNDLSIRLLLAGYQLRLVKNSFIFHYGGKSFQQMPDQYVQLLKENSRKLEQKYGMDLIPASRVETALIDMISPVSSSFCVLEVGCRLGATLARIESRHPQAKVLGIEKNQLLAHLAGQVIPVVQGDFLKDYSEDEKFDVIILDQILNSKGEEILEKAASILKTGGQLLSAVSNAQCIKERKSDSGASLEDITKWCNCCRLQIRDFQYRRAALSEEEKRTALKLCGTKDSPLWPLYEAETFLFSAVRS